MSLGGNAFSLCGKLVKTRFNVFSQILNYTGISKAKTNKDQLKQILKNV